MSKVTDSSHSYVQYLIHILQNINIAMTNEYRLLYNIIQNSINQPLDSTVYSSFEGANIWLEKLKNVLHKNYIKIRLKIIYRRSNIESQTIKQNIVLIIRKLDQDSCPLCKCLCNFFKFKIVATTSSDQKRVRICTLANMSSVKMAKLKIKN